MLGNNTSDVVQSTATLVFAVACLVIGVIAVRRFGRVQADVRGVKLTMDAVTESDKKRDVVLASIDMSVNHKQSHEPTMVRRLAIVEAAVITLAAKFDTFADGTRQWQSGLVDKIGLDVRAANGEQTAGGGS